MNRGSKNWKMNCISRVYRNCGMNSKDKANKNLGAFALIMLIILVCLSGCSLASPQLQDIKNGDKLIGVFVTCEDDLKDYSMQEGDTLYYDEKKIVSAGGSTRKLTDEEFESFKGFDEGFTVEGTKQDDDTYKFEDIEGYYMGNTVKTVEEDGEKFLARASNYSDGVYDVKFGIKMNSKENSNSIKGLFGSPGINEIKAFNEVNDIINIADDEKAMPLVVTEETLSMEATIGISSQKEEEIRINRVYQRDDGSVYTNIPGSACMVIDADSGAGTGAISISESYQSNITGTGIKSQTKKETAEFKVNIEQVDFLESALVRHMDKNHKLVSVTEVNLTKHEQELKLDKKTDYIIIEEHFIDRKGKPYSKRTAYDCMRIGEVWDDGYEEFVSHTFYCTNENEKIELVDLSFER